MENLTTLLFIIFVPCILAFSLPLIGRFSSRLRNLLALVFVSVSVVLSLKLLPLVISGQSFTFTKTLGMGINFALTLDGLSVFMACVSSFISAVIILYSFGYISHYDNQNEYYTMVVLFLGAMMGLVFSGNLIFLYIFWEITAITSWRLIGFFREKQHVRRADKAFMVTFFGAILMLLGFIRLAQEAGSFDLLVIRQHLTTHSVSGLTIALILAGIFSKSATLPFHTWLPDAGVAPSPVTALLHAAVLVKIGVYVFARLFIVNIPLAVNWQVIVAAIAGTSALVAAGAALVDTDLKRIIAYSTISQIGFIFLGFAFNNSIGVSGALLYILMHGLAKAGLFLCAGVVEQNTKTKDITKLGGLIKTMPVTALSFLFCAFSVMGIPPFGGFFSKYLVMTGAFSSGHLIIAFTFLAGAVLTILYLFRAFNMVFLGEPKTAPVREGSPVMLFSVALFAGLSLLGGFLIAFPGDVVQAATRQILLVMK